MKNIVANLKFVGIVVLLLAAGVLLYTCDHARFVVKL